MKRIGLVLGATLLSGAFAITGCKKDEKKEDATKPADPAAAPATTDVAKDAPGGGMAATTPASGEGGAADVPPAGGDLGGGDDDVKAVEPSAEEKALGEKAAQLMDDMAKVAEKHKDDCDKAAAELKVVFEKAKPVLEAGKKFKEEPGKQKWLEEKYGARIMGAMTKMMPLIQKCENHEGLNKLFEDMR